MLPWLLWLPLAAVVLVAVVLAGRGTGGDVTPGPSRPRPSPTAGPTASPAAGPARLSAASARAVVRDVALLAADLPAGFGAGGAGDRRRDVTLAAGPRHQPCPRGGDGGRTDGRTDGRIDAGGDWRALVALGRERVAFASGDHRLRVVQEVVAYPPGGADRAVDALRRGVERCSRPVPAEPVQQPSTLALRVLLDRSAGAPRREVLLERSGEVVSLLQVEGPAGDLALELARTTGVRLLQALPGP